jgi:hypothetical protein
MRSSPAWSCTSTSGCLAPILVFRRPGQSDQPETRGFASAMRWTETHRNGRQSPRSLGPNVCRSGQSGDLEGTPGARAGTRSGYRRGSISRMAPTPTTARTRRSWMRRGRSAPRPTAALVCLRMASRRQFRRSTTSVIGDRHHRPRACDGPAGRQLGTAAIERDPRIALDRAWRGRSPASSRPCLSLTLWGRGTRAGLSPQNSHADRSPLLEPPREVRVVGDESPEVVNEKQGASPSIRVLRDVGEDLVGHLPHVGLRAN